MNCPAERHDRETDYINHGCICPGPRELHRKLRNKRKLHMLERGPMLQPALPTCLRLRALTAIGYSGRDLAAHSFLTEGHINQLRSHEDKTVTPRIAAEVDRLYRLLSATPGTNKRAIAHGRRLGYADPLTLEAPVDNAPIVDEVAVERYVNGDRIPLSYEEKEVAIRVALTRGWPPNQVSTRLRVNIQRVYRVQRGEKRGPGGRRAA